MVRNISDKLLIDELRILDLALKNGGIITERDLEKKHIDKDSIFAPCDEGYLKQSKEDSLEISYTITEKGENYFSQSLASIRFPYHPL